MKKKKDEVTIRFSAAEYLTYIASVGDQQDGIEMRYEDENIWLTQKMMAALYDVDVCTINEHIKKIYADSELEEESTIRNFQIVQTEGTRQITRDTKHYSLQMIIAVGFMEEGVNVILQSGLAGFFGCEKHRSAWRHTGNSSNGFYRRTIVTSYGIITVDVPRECSGEFQSP